jgi:Sulfotransferase family
MTEPAPFFIVASARSGTTMLRLILNRHPRIAVPPESRFITELWQGSDQVEVDNFLGRLAAHERFAAWELSIEAVHKELGENSTVSYHDAITAAYRAYARSKGKDLWGDKTPRYVEHIPFLARLFPGSRFIHLVRDGRDVALSYADVSFGPKTVSSSAHLWAKRVSAGIRDGRALGPARYTEIRYEQLVEDADPQLHELCAFLGVSFEPIMLHGPGSNEDDVLSRAAAYNPHVTDKPKSGVREWRRTMRARHVEMFEAVAGGVLSELEYPRQYPSPSLLARTAAYLGGRGVPIGRVAAKTRRVISKVTGKQRARPPSP